MSWLRAIQASASVGLADPRLVRSPIPWQLAFLRDESPIRLVRAANQVGKTTAMVDDMLGFARGDLHRGRRPPGPVNMILCSVSEEQMSQEGGILEKLFAALRPGEVDARVRFERGVGLRGVGDGRAIRFRTGPAAGSVIRLRTFNQDPQTLAGATVHGVWIDEPCPKSTYDELLPRVQRHDGLLTLSFTPTPDMPDMRWLEDLVRAGAIREHHITLTEANTTPAGAARPIYDQGHIDRWRALTPLGSQAMRFEAAWEPVITDKAVSGFEPGTHVRAFTTADVLASVRASGSQEDVHVMVGTDHGLVACKQRSVLILVTGIGDRSKMRVWYLDEVAEDDASDSILDARRILAMLARHGLSYTDVDEWIGDRSTGDGRQATSKSNADLRSQLLHQAGISGRDKRAKFIATPRKWSGSVHYGVGLMHELFVTGRALVNASCPKLALSLATFRGGYREPVKDVFDAARYPTERAAAWQSTVPVKAHVWGR